MEFDDSVYTENYNYIMKAIKETKVEMKEVILENIELKARNKELEKENKKLHETILQMSQKK